MERSTGTLLLTTDVQGEARRTPTSLYHVPVLCEVRIYTPHHHHTKQEQRGG